MHRFAPSFSVRLVLLTAALLPLCVSAHAQPYTLPEAPAVQPPGAAPATGPSPKRFDGDAVIRTHLRTIRQLMTMNALSDDPWSERIGIGTVDYRVSPEALEAVQAAGIEFEILIPDVQALIDSERSRIADARRQQPQQQGLLGVNWFSEFKDNDEVNDRLNELALLRPDLVTPINIGDSLLGKPVHGVRITAPGNDGTRPAILIHGCQHAREWISVMVTMYIADQLVHMEGEDPRITALLGAAEIIVIPIVNPDGYEYSWTTNRLWRKNRRANSNGSFGVDPNRNWSYAWGGPGSSGSGGSEIYRGTEPFSEPETANLRDFIFANPRIVSHLDVHSYGQLVLQPWGWTTDLPIDHVIFDDLGAEMVQAVLDAGGVQFTHGATGASLYIASGGAADWTYGDQSIASLTIELRDTGQFGFILPASQIIPSCLEFMPAFLHFAEWSAQPAAFGWPIGRPQTIDANEETGVALLIRPIAADLDASSARLYQRTQTGGAFTETVLNSDDDLTYTGVLSAPPCNSVVEYYVQILTSDGAVLRDPPNAPTDVYTALSVDISIIVDDDMSTDQGWIVGAQDDDATTGIWERVDPVGTFAGGTPVQPSSAYAGEFCWVTGQHPGGGAGANDVDNGKTTLTTPPIDLSVAGPRDDVTISYVRWYSNSAGANPNNDVFVVDISADGGATWVNVETVGPAGSETNGGWFHVAFDPRTLVPLTGQMRLRFVASDYDPQALVEAAIDLLRVTITSCDETGLIGDLNGDGIVDSSDLLLMLSAWGPCDPEAPCPADLTGDGNVTSADLLLLLSNWS